MKHSFLLVSCIAAFSCVAGALSFSVLKPKITSGVSGDLTYSVTADTSHLIDFDDPAMFTKSGNRIDLAIEGNVQEYGASLLVASVGASIRNTTPINGMKAIYVKAANGTKWEVSYGFMEGDTIRYLPGKVAQSYGDNTLVFDLDNRLPSYFKLKFVSGSFGRLNRVSIDFSCEPSNQVKEIYDSLPGFAPTLSGDGKTLTFGYYPTDFVSDYKIKNQVSSAETYHNPIFDGGSLRYVYYDGKVYTKKAATPYYSSGTTFTDGVSGVTSGTTYYYEATPIQWRVLTHVGNKYLVVSEKLLDAKKFYGDSYRSDVYENNYEQSTVRTWLNGEFFKDAFMVNSDLVETTTVDNSGRFILWGDEEHPEGPDNPYGSNDTQDKVFLLSASEIVNADYGFANATGADDARVAISTDFAIASGVKYSTLNYSAPYILRTPYANGQYHVWSVSNNGYMEPNSVYYSHAYPGMRPAMWVTIPE